MKRLTSKGALLSALILLSLGSCFPQKDYLYTDTGMCTVLGGGRLLTDTGLTYHVVENESANAIADTLKRIMISCDVLRATNGRTDEYDICVKEFMGALVSDPVFASEAPEDLGTDGVGVTQAWVSGGYLNAYVNITMLPIIAGEHDLNLLYDDVKSNTDTLYMQMRHNAHGECPESGEISPSNLVFGGTYLSFPVDAIIPTGKKPVIYLEWDWYPEGNVYSGEKRTYSGYVLIQ